MFKRVVETRSGVAAAPVLLGLVLALVIAPPCYGKFHGLGRCCRYSLARLTHQQVNVLGHHDITGDYEPVANKSAWHRRQNNSQCDQGKGLDLRR